MERQIASYRSICIFKVLRPANLSKALCDFPRSQRKCSVVSQNPNSTARLAPTETNVKFFAKAYPTQPYKHFVEIYPPSTRFGPYSQQYTSQNLRLLPAYLYQKDEWASIVTLMHYTPCPSFILKLSLSLSLSLYLSVILGPSLKDSFGHADGLHKIVLYSWNFPFWLFI